MSACTLYGRIVQHTKEAFGQPVWPHLFRDAAITSLGEEQPEHVWLGMSLLHHADPRIAERHYNQALESHAVQNYQALIKDQRRRMIVANLETLPPDVIRPALRALTGGKILLVPKEDGSLDAHVTGDVAGMVELIAATGSKRSGRLAAVGRQLRQKYKAPRRKLITREDERRLAALHGEELPLADGHIALVEAAARFTAGLVAGARYPLYRKVLWLSSSDPISQQMQTSQR